MKTRAPRRHPLTIACNRGRGFSLLEVSLALAAAAAIGTATFLVFRPSSTVAAVRVEQANLRDLSQAVENSFGMVGGFAGATTARVSEDGLVPSAMLRGGSFRNHWGGSVEVAPAEVFQPNDAFAIAYPSVPSDACVGLAGAVADSVYDLKIGGHSVFTGGSLDPAALASRCSTDGGANMIFVYHSGLATGTAVAATPVTNPPPVVAPPTTPPSPPGTTVAPPVAPPVVVTPPVIVAPPPVVAPPTAPPMVTPPGTPGVTPPTAPPSGPPAVAPPYTQTCQAQLPGPETQTRAGTVQGQVLDCAASNYGQVNQARTPSEARTRSWFCPDENGNPSNEPWGDPTATLWTAWAVTSNGTWATTANTCTACPAPYTDTDPRWDPRSLGCPAGTTGTHTRDYAQTRTRSVSTVCPVGTRTLPAPTVGAWSAWGDTGATRNDVNTCAANCVLPMPSTQSQAQNVTETRTVACPAPQTGAGIHQARTLGQISTRIAYCPAPTGAYSWGSWSGWATTSTGAWSETSRDCTAPPPTCTATTRTDMGWSVGPIPPELFPPLRACGAGNIGQHSFASLVSCGSGSGPCGGSYRAAICTASGWNIVSGAGSSPYHGWTGVDPMPADWVSLKAQGEGDWTTLGGTGNNRAWTTYQCPPF